MGPHTTFGASPMRAVLLNDTRSADHVGCSLVVENILRECQRVGIETVRLVTTAQAAEATHLLQSAPGHDLVLINGEGTMHHDRPAAAQFCEAARFARRNGKKVVLLNSVWQSNIKLREYLPDFHMIVCRDSFSAKEVEEAGAPAQVAPDMIFASPPFHFADPTGPRTAVVIDSIQKRTSRRLALFAIIHKLPFLTMDRVGAERIRRMKLLSALLRWRCGWEGAAPAVTEFARKVSRSSRVISGRFHGTCLAFILDRPVASVGSNTHKLEALYQDAGLPSEAVLQKLPLSMETVESRHLAPLVLNFESARSYVSNARRRIPEVFEEIAAL